MSKTADVNQYGVPSHIQPDLVRDLTIGRGLKTTRLPHDVVAEIHRDFPPVFYAPNLMNGGGWVFRRAVDQRVIWEDAEHFSSKQIQPFAQLAGGNWRMVPVEQDPPDHTFYRKLLRPFFTPKAAKEMDEKILSYARSAVLDFRERGHCEFMREFGLRFPIRIFLEMMGMPLERADEFLEWETIMLRDDDMDRVTNAVASVVDYFSKEIEVRRANPGDDLMGFALNAEVDGRKLNHDELIGLFFNLFLGGLDTVSAHLGHIFRHLAEHPEHQRELRNNPEMIDAAIDEFMRAYGSVTITRTCVKDVEVAGVHVREGERVALSTPLICRDPEEYDDPDEVKFGRKARLMSFGTGIHLCLGMHLARREMRHAMGQFFELLPEFRVPPGTEVVSDLGTVMMPFTLPLEWDVSRLGH